MLRICRALKLKIEELRRLTHTANGISYDIQSCSPMRDAKGSLEKQIETLLELEKRWVDKLVEAEQYCTQLEEKIQSVANEGIMFATVLFHRYINGYKISTIAEIIHYSLRQTKSILREAIEVFSKKINHCT